MSRRIEDLNPTFQPMVRQLLDSGQQTILSTGWIFFITDGFRSFDEQTSLYAQGRTKPGKIVTNAKAGQSPHNYGLGVDLAFQKHGVLSYDKQLYDKIYPIARNLGFELGVDWTNFIDKPHFEHPNWKQLKGEPMPDALQECLAQHKQLVSEANQKDKEIFLLNETIRGLEKEVSELKKPKDTPAEQKAEIEVLGKTWIANGIQVTSNNVTIVNYKLKE